MQKISPHQLWIGSAGDVRDVMQLYDNEIIAVIDLAYEEPPTTLPREFTYCRFPLSDDGENTNSIISVAIQTCVSFLTANIPILIGCSAGMSRSPVIAAVSLSIITQTDAAEMLEQIRQQKSVDVSPAYWNQVISISKLMK